jgi:hypothetical protein
MYDLHRRRGFSQQILSQTQVRPMESWRSKLIPTSIVLAMDGNTGLAAQPQ